MVLTLVLALGTLFLWNYYIEGLIFGAGSRVITVRAYFVVFGKDFNFLID